MRKKNFVPVLKEAVPLKHNPLAGGLQVVSNAWTAEKIEAHRAKYLAQATELRAALDARTTPVNAISLSAHNLIMRGWMPPTRLGQKVYQLE